MESKVLVFTAVTLINDDEIRVVTKGESAQHLLISMIRDLPENEPIIEVLMRELFKKL